MNRGLGPTCTGTARPNAQATPKKQKSANLKKLAEQRGLLYNHTVNKFSESTSVFAPLLHKYSLRY